MLSRCNIVSRPHQPLNHCGSCISETQSVCALSYQKWPILATTVCVTWFNSIPFNKQFNWTHFKKVYNVQLFLPRLPDVDSLCPFPAHDGRVWVCGWANYRHTLDPGSGWMKGGCRKIKHPFWWLVWCCPLGWCARALVLCSGGHRGLPAKIILPFPFPGIPWR